MSEWRAGSEGYFLGRGEKLNSSVFWEESEGTLNTDLL